MPEPEPHIELMPMGASLKVDEPKPKPVVAAPPKPRVTPPPRLISDEEAEMPQTAVPQRNARAQSSVWPRLIAAAVVLVALTSGGVMAARYFSSSGNASPDPVVSGTVVVNTDPNTPLFEDKDWIAVDKSMSAYSGNLYVSWTHNDTNGGHSILFSRSTDHAQTWSAPIPVSPNNPKNWRGGILGSQLAVGPNGEVYVTWKAIGLNDPNGQDTLLIRTSTNFGVSFASG